jgi:PE family
MTFVTTQPEKMAAAADEVSALTAAQFASHAAMYQAVSAHAAAVHELFVSALSGSAGCYAATEAANATSVI